MLIMEKLSNIAVGAALVAVISLTLSSLTMNEMSRLDKRIDGALSSGSVSSPASVPAASSSASGGAVHSSDKAFALADDLKQMAERRHLAGKAAALISSHPFCSLSVVHYESCSNQIESVDRLVTSTDATVEHILNSSLMQGPTETLLVDSKNTIVHAGNLYSHLIGQTLNFTKNRCEGKATGLCTFLTDKMDGEQRLITMIDAKVDSMTSDRRRGFFNWLGNLFSGSGSNSNTNSGSAVTVSGSGKARSAPPSSSSGVLSMHVTGASAATARGEGFSSPGVATSAAVVRRDEGRLSNYKEQIVNAANKYSIAPEVIGGIISRETHAGGAIGGRWNGLGDGGHAFGLMQIDFRYHTPDQSSVQAHINQGTGILKSMIDAVAKKHPDWPRAKQVQGGIAAYNSGVGNIQTQGGIDIGTTHNDYSNDVIARAQALSQDNFFRHSSGVSDSAASSSSSSSGVLSLPVTGASYATARGEGFSAAGVATSAAVVRRDEGRLSNYKEQIMNAAHKYNIPPEVIGGIISRETHAGGAIGGRWNGKGDGGHAFGLMQVDYRYHTPDTSSVQAHIDQGTSILSNAINAVSKKHPDWPRDKQIQGGIAAYNSGPGNIQTQGGIDIGSTHNDYSNDVIARAQALHQDGFFN
eukprot:TRINITY_DN12491_c1_g1_i9.p1 TRINITY_DN12491_c1_g1~~TRINITY_DN12491_c1_g1_i9.p1  ORF type:complete len:640 (+),score=171.03 TRINITY_DN12491_c1_g1_i9:1432-3351(+)